MTTAEIIATCELPHTFNAMFAASELKNLGPAEARFPSLEHLIALKLHVLKWCHEAEFS